MKIWTVTYNDDAGSPDASVHLTRAEAVEAAHGWLDVYWQDALRAVTEAAEGESNANASLLAKMKAMTTFHERYEFLYSNPSWFHMSDTVTITEHDLSADASEIWRQLTADASTFGVLYDHTDVLANIDGLEDADGNEVDINAPDMIAAVKSWCADNASSFTDGMSRIFYANLPGWSDLQPYMKTPRFYVKGHTHDDPESDLAPDGMFAPFYVFDVTTQHHVTGPLDRDTASELAASLNDSLPKES